MFTYKQCLTHVKIVYMYMIMNKADRERIWGNKSVTLTAIYPALEFAKKMAYIVSQRDRGFTGVQSDDDMGAVSYRETEKLLIKELVKLYHSGGDK